MPSGLMPHYQPCLLVCCLTIGHAFWCCASSSTMPVGVVPHDRPCLLVWYLTICHAFCKCHCNQHFTSRVQTEEGWLQVWCYLYSGAIISDMSDNPVPLLDMPSCTTQLLSDMHAGFMNSSTHVCKVLLYRQGIWSVTNPPDMPRGMMPLAQGCKTFQVPSWTPS